MKLIDELGGPMTYPHYPVLAGLWRRTLHSSATSRRRTPAGITYPMIVHWPKTIKDKGGIRSQYHHMIDITPTVLELIGVQPTTSRERRGSTANGRIEPGLHF